MTIIHPDAAAERQRICRRLALERTIRGLTQRDLAAHLGDRQSNVGAFELGRRAVHLDTAISYAWAVGVNVGVIGDHHVPLLDLTADEVMAVQVAAGNYADTMPSGSTIPGMPAFVAALRSALTKLEANR